MTAEILVEAPKVTVGFNRKINLGNYESAEASIFIQVPTAPGQSVEEIVASGAIKLAFADAKANVFEQLGITSDVVEGVVIEKLRQQLGAVEVSSAPSQQASVSAPPSSGGGVPTSREDKVNDLITNPTKWFDNRATKTGKQPDFKRKGKPAAGEQYPPSLWVDDFKKVGRADEVPEPSAF